MSQTTCNPLQRLHLGRSHQIKHGLASSLTQPSRVELVEVARHFFPDLLRVLALSCKAEASVKLVPGLGFDPPLLLKGACVDG